jgi:transposase
VPLAGQGFGLILKDGLVEIDSNTVERTIRPIKLGTRSHLLAGSDGSAESWVIVATLIQTAKLTNVEPIAYVHNVLERVISGKTNANQLSTLLPWAWKASQDSGTNKTEDRLP